MQICFASHNANKVKELGAIMPDWITIVGLADLGVEIEIEETGSSLEENSRIKARYVYDNHNIPVIADDSGLLVDALDGEPGVYSARYAGPQKNDDDNMNLLLGRLSKTTSGRSAEFQTIITYIDESAKQFQFKGSVKGQIIDEKRGANGFGYDPIFMPDGYNETFGELSNEVKNSISHRSIAVNKFLKHLESTHV